MAQGVEGRIDMLHATGILIFEEIDPPSGQTAEKFVAYMTKAPIPIAGYGGWSRVARPRRRALTEWVGRDSISMEFEFLIDTWEDRQGDWTEAKIRSLERMAGIGIPNTDPQPPLIEVDGRPEPLIPFGKKRNPGKKWFVDTLTWDKDSFIYGSTGNRRRAGGTVVVTEFVEDERLDPIKRRRGGKGKKGRRKKYRVKEGDTLSKIAARKDVYGNAKLWRRIAKANNIRDPKNLKVGRELKIP
jgi:hypothetical protein